MGLESVMLEHIYAMQDAFSGTDVECAENLIKFYRDESVEVIYVTISYFLCCAGDGEKARMIFHKKRNLVKILLQE